MLMIRKGNRGLETRGPEKCLINKKNHVKFQKAIDRNNVISYNSDVNKEETENTLIDRSQREEENW